MIIDGYNIINEHACGGTEGTQVLQGMGAIIF
jgi:hypothetical protein